MHTLNRFALNCGAQQSTPSLDTAFFPLPFQDYITLNKFSSHSSQIYDYWNDVIREILPFLQEKGIQVIEIGDKAEGIDPLRHTYDLRGTLNIKQMAYVIKNSIYHLSGDSFCADIANVLRTKVCQIFGSTPPYLLAPQWNKDLVTILTPSGSAPPAFNATTKIKSINTIYPETISTVILNALGLPHHLESLRTKFIGNKYHLPLIDVVPDFNPTPGLLAGNTIHLRLDYEFNEAPIPLWCADSRKLVLVTDKEINLNIIRQCKGALIQFAYEIDSDTSFDYLTALKNTGVPLYLFTHTQKKNELKNLRLQFIDWDIEHQETLTKKHLDNCANIDYNTALYKSSKVVLSKEKEFPCKQAWLLNMPDNPNEVHPIFDHEEFWKEQQHLRIIQQIK